MRTSDILGIIAIAVVSFGIGWTYGEYDNISKAKHTEVIQNYAAAIDVYRDYTKALEQSVEIPDVPSLKLLRENVTNNELCDLPTDNFYNSGNFKIEPVYRSLSH